MTLARIPQRRTIRAAAVAAALVAAAACSPSTPDSAAHPSAVGGRAAFVAGDYAGARDLFTRAAQEAPNDHLAVLGVARSNHQLHRYEAALEWYRKALELAPGDSITWQGYLGALTWGGLLEGNGQRLEATLMYAPTTLALVPGNVELYAHVRTAAAELNRLDEYADTLQVVADRLPDNPIVDIELTKALIDDARRARNAAIAAVGARASAIPDDDDSDASALADRAEELESALRADLDALAAAASREPATDPGVLYKLSVGYELLGDEAAAESAVDVLESTEEGRRLAAPQRYGQFLDEWMAGFDADTSARLEITDRWLPRFEPGWDNDGTRHRAILGMQFELLVGASRGPSSPDENGPTADGEPVGLSEDEADRIARVGRRLARIDTWRAASRYVETASVLARTPSHYVTAVRVTDDGIAALRDNRPGLLYPGTPEDEREQLRMRYLAVLMQLQGQALHNLGRNEEAEQILRQAIALHPVAASYAVLGGQLLDGGRDAEAFDLLVAALAHGFSAAEAVLEKQTHASALAAAESIGASPEVVDAAVGFAAERIDEERDREIVADPLDVPAPDFELADTAEGTWRLSDLAGKVVVLNYWATWCGPCIAEMPYYQQLVDEYAAAADVVFLAISTDSDPSIVAPFIEERGHTFTVLYDDGSAIDFQVTGIPASFVIGKDGLIKYRTSGFPGPERYLNEMRLRIEALLAPQR